jgi:hypothetical protein
VIPFSLFIEASVQTCSCPLESAQILLKEAAIKWGKTFQPSRLILRCGRTRRILAGQYSAHAQNTLFDVLKEWLPHVPVAHQRPSWINILASPKIAFPALIAGAILMFLLITIQPAPIPLHSLTVEGKTTPLTNIPPRYRLQNFTGGASFLTFAHDSATLVTNTGYYSATYVVWDASTGTHIRTVGENETLSVSAGFADASGFFSPAQIVIADMVYELGLGVWNPKFGRTFSAPREALIAGKMSVMSYSTYANLFAAVEWEKDETIHLWRLSDAVSLPPLSVIKDGNIEMTRLWFSPTGQFLIAEYKPAPLLRGYGPPELAVFDLSTRKHLVTLTGHRRYHISSMAFSSDEKTMATGSDDKQLIVWNLSQPEKSVTFTGHKYEIHDIAFSPDDRWLVSVAGYSEKTRPKPGEVKIWDLASQQPVATVRTASEPEQVAFSPDGRLLAVSQGHYYKEKGEVLVWNFKEILQSAKIALQ